MVSLNRIFELLSEERRRYALYYLEQQEEPIAVETLAEQIAEWESDPLSFDFPEEKRPSVEIELQHKHLPKASKAEFVEYDSENETVEVTGTPAEFSAIISVSETIERPSSD
jgi:hypothetical protein